MPLLKKIVLVIAFLVFAVLMLPGIIRPPSENTSGDKTQVKGLAGALVAALVDFREKKGHFPSGNAGEIMAALRAESDTETPFFTPAPESLNDHGELLDPWGTPFRITFDPAANLPHVQSAGPNLIFEEKGQHHMSSDDYFSWK